MESRIQNPPMFDPLFAFVHSEASGEEPGEGVLVRLPEVAELIG